MLHKRTIFRILNDILLCVFRYVICFQDKVYLYERFLTKTHIKVLSILPMEKSSVREFESITSEPSRQLLVQS